MNYFITAIPHFADRPWHKSLPRTFGYFSDLDRALEAVEQNECDMHECLYNFIVVECIREGIHPITDGNTNEHWFGWIMDRWTRIPKPEWSEGTLNWALG